MEALDGSGGSLLVEHLAGDLGASECACREQEESSTNRVSNLPSFKVALVSVDAPEVPAWVSDEITQNGVELVIKDCKSAEEVVEVASNANLVWVFGGGKVIPEECLPKLKECVAILRSGSGTDNIPVKRATELGIIVANTPQATSVTVADHTIALFLSLIRKITYQDRRVRQGVWSYRDIVPPINLTGKVFGLLGFGHIARQVVRRLVGFDFQFLAHDPFVDNSIVSMHGATWCSFDELLKRSDILSVHCPLTEHTFHLIDEAALRKMKSTAILINTSRGPLVDEVSLYEALKEQRIGGAALDVVETPPGTGEQPLISLDNVILTPHMAGYAENYLDPFWEYSVTTVLDIAKGISPRSCVNPEVQSRASRLKT